VQPHDILNMSGASLSCSTQTRADVTEYKNRHGLASYDMALQHMLNELHKGRAHAGSDSDDGGARRMEDDDEEKEHVGQLFSCSDILKEDKAVKYWTGLKRPAFNWVRETLEEAVRNV
jgi:hypothetical protein